MNHSVLIGFLGKDPEERISKNGKKGIFFSLAVDSYYAKEKKTQWYNIAIWDESLFPMALSLKKGSLASVVGTLLPPQTYETKSGESRIGLTLKCCALYFLPSSQRPTEKKEPSKEELDDHLNW